MDITMGNAICEPSRTRGIAVQIQDNERVLFALAARWLAYAHDTNDATLESLALAMFEDLRGY